MSFGSISFLRRDESRSNPNTDGTVGQCRSETTAVEDAASGDHVDGSAGEWALLALDGVDASWDEEGRWDVSGVSSTWY